MEPESKGLSKQRTFYHQMDVRFIGRDPLLKYMRHYKTFQRRLAKAKGKKATAKVRRMTRDTPKPDIDHIVKER